VHTTVLRSHEFELTVKGRPVTIDGVFPGFDEHDRLGIVLAADHAAAGAATLMLAAVTAFYDRLRAASDDFFAYPDYFAFHIHSGRGSLRKLDVHPEHKELVVPADVEQIVRAINDRGITRLLIPAAPLTGTSAGAGGAGTPKLGRDTRASAERRIRTAVAYSPTGRVVDGDIVVKGSRRAESFVEAMLGAGDTPRRRAAARDQDGRPTESFRGVTIDTALGMLVTAAQ
jgi:hypothetical protein